MTQHSQSEFHGTQITPATPSMTGQPQARSAGWTPPEETPANWAPPEAPLAMPRQQLEREDQPRRRFSLFSAFRQSAV